MAAGNFGKLKIRRRLTYGNDENSWTCSRCVRRASVILIGYETWVQKEVHYGQNITIASAPAPTPAPALGASLDILGWYGELTHSPRNILTAFQIRRKCCYLSQRNGQTNKYRDESCIFTKLSSIIQHICQKPHSDKVFCNEKSVLFKSTR